MRAYVCLAMICGLHLKMSCDSGTDPFSVFSLVVFFLYFTFVF